MAAEHPTPPWPEPKDPILRLTIETALKRASQINPEHAIVHAAAHGWMEGHILAEEGRRPRPEPVFVATAERPTPPFPSEHSERLIQIVQDELLRHRGQLGEGALSEIVIASAARGWAAGYDEGLSCIGCLPPGGEWGLAVRSLMRKGLLPIPAALDPLDEELLGAAIATYKDQLAARTG